MQKTLFRLSIFFMILLFLFSCKTNVHKQKEEELEKFVTKEISENYNYDELNAHMEALFNLLEIWISQGNFEAWYNHTSRSYKYYLNDPSNLKKIAEESDFLYNRNIKLRGPRDYFRYVVIESREGRLLKYEGYKYINNYHVKVFCLFDKNEKFVYDFIYEEGEWRVNR